MQELILFNRSFEDQFPIKNQMEDINNMIDRLVRANQQLRIECREHELSAEGYRGECSELKSQLSHLMGQLSEAGLEKLVLQPVLSDKGVSHNPFVRLPIDHQVYSNYKKCLVDRQVMAAQIGRLTNDLQEMQSGNHINVIGYSQSKRWDETLKSANSEVQKNETRTLKETVASLQCTLLEQQHSYNELECQWKKATNNPDVLPAVNPYKTTARECFVQTEPQVHVSDKGCNTECVVGLPKLTDTYLAESTDRSGLNTNSAVADICSHRLVIMMKQAKIIESERQSVSDLLEKVNRNEVDSHLEHDKLREEANYASKKARIFKERLENIESQWNRLASTFESTVIEIRSHAEKQANDCETGAKSFMTQHQSATKLLVKSLMKKVHQSIASGTVRTWSSSSDFADNKCLCVQKGIAKLYASFMAPEADSVLKNAS
eukprot:Filipodium_phascolosomae@DN2323_c0_g1_i4.p1